MSARVAVTKMHGARNDFIVLDARSIIIEDLPSLARRLCDRHIGIGADGILVVGSSDRADASMRVINADGSEAEMCGNGVRCVARYLDERGESGSATIETLAGLIRTTVVDRGEIYLIRVDMGFPRVLGLELPFADALAVDTGNPHVVLFRSSPDELDVVAVAQALRQSEEFPGGTNVHIAVVENKHAMRVRHYERGAGFTMACGTGAVACVAAAIARSEVASPVTVHVPGGDLLIEIHSDGRAYMTGPAAHVFDTTIDINAPELV